MAAQLTTTKGLLARWANLMNAPGNELFSCACLSRNQHRGVAHCDHPGKLIDVLHGAPIANHSGEGVSVSGARRAAGELRDQGG